MSFRPPRGTLAELVADAREDCATRKRQRPHLVFEVTQEKPSGRGFEKALRDSTLPGFALICEVKRASPSAGSLKHGDSATRRAQAYVAGGARCVSVLTEQRRFGGSLDDLRAVRQVLSVPLLRKDFIVDPYMVHEAADAGADCILLIAGALEPSALVELEACAKELGLDVLLEFVHERELDVLNHLHSRLVGVNARDLETLEMDASRFERLAPRLLGDGRLVVAESGVGKPEDVIRLAKAGAGAALVGESLMRSDDAQALVRRLTEAG